MRGGFKMLSFFLNKVANGDFFSEVHSFKFEELNILLDINSGSVHLLDDISYDTIDALKRSNGCEQDFWSKMRGTDVQAVKGTVAELHELVEQDMLFTKSYLEDVKPERLLDSVVKSLCLHISHDCNMGCKYCFAGQGEFGGPKMHMSIEVGQKALDFLLDNSGNKRSCEVDFFGGEPLLNWRTIEALVDYGKTQAAKKNKKINFTLTTNGLLLNPQIEEFLNNEQISVVISLDGRKEVHNQMRPLRSGKGSHEHIIDKAKSLVASRKGINYFIRGTYTHNNLDFAEDVLFLADQGFTEISLEPVVALPDESYALREEDKEQLKEQYNFLACEYWKRKIAGKPFNFFHFNINLENAPCIPKRMTGCGAGYQYLAVAPDGEIYPCHQFVGKPEYCLGNVEKGVFNKQTIERFRSCHILNKECRNCWARFHCSGGCHASALSNNGSIEKPYEMGCYLQKLRLEAAIYLAILAKMQYIIQN